MYNTEVGLLEGDGQSAEKCEDLACGLPADSPASPKSFLLLGVVALKIPVVTMLLLIAQQVELVIAQNTLRAATLDEIPHELYDAWPVG